MARPIERGMAPSIDPSRIHGHELSLPKNCVAQSIDAGSLDSVQRPALAPSTRPPVPPSLRSPFLSHEPRTRRSVRAPALFYARRRLGALGLARQGSGDRPRPTTRLIRAVGLTMKARGRPHLRARSKEGGRRERRKASGPPTPPSLGPRLRRVASGEWLVMSCCLVELLLLDSNRKAPRVSIDHTQPPDGVDLKVRWCFGASLSSSPVCSGSRTPRLTGSLALTSNSTDNRQVWSVVRCSVVAGWLLRSSAITVHRVGCWRVSVTVTTL